MQVVSAVKDVISDRADFRHAPVRRDAASVKVKRVIGRRFPQIVLGNLRDGNGGPPVVAVVCDGRHRSAAHERELATLEHDTARCRGKAPRLRAIQDDTGDRKLTVERFALGLEIDGTGKAILFAIVGLGCCILADERGERFGTRFWRTRCNCVISSLGTNIFRQGERRRYSGKRFRNNCRCRNSDRIGHKNFTRCPSGTQRKGRKTCDPKKIEHQQSASCGWAAIKPGETKCPGRPFRLRTACFLPPTLWMWHNTTARFSKLRLLAQWVNRQPSPLVSAAKRSAFGMSSSTIHRSGSRWQRRDNHDSTSTGSASEAGPTAAHS